MLLFSIPIFLFGLVVAQNGIHWQGDWAFNCDFNKNDLTNARVPGSQCSNKCSQTPGCTHFVWTTYNGGTCWMKKGSVSKSNAYWVSDKSQVCGVLANSNNQPPVSSSGSIESLKGQLLWSDEFDSTSNFMNNWNQETGGHGWGNNELQYYTNNNHNTEIKSGMLTINTRKEMYGSNRFTSARLVSKRQFRYGVFEMRAKLPYGRGTWPAFWLLSAKKPLNWPTDGEIDIMEHVGYDQNRIHATIHCSDFNHKKGSQKTSSTVLSDVSNQYHLYQLYWSQNSIRGFVDGQLFFKYDRPANSNFNNWPYDTNFNIILNTAVGGFWGGAKGIDENIYPQRFVIDYVRVYAPK